MFPDVNNVLVKEEMPSPVKTCSFEEQIKGYFLFVNLHDMIIAFHLKAN